MMRKTIISLVGIETVLLFIYLYSNQPSKYSPETSDSPNKLYQIGRVKELLENSEKAYQRYASRRRGLVGSRPASVNPCPNKPPIVYFYEYFLPVFACPHTIQRIGRMGDGGKFVCGFELFETPSPNKVQQGSIENEPCIVYSFGINNESSFEAEFVERTNCEIFGFDASVSEMGPEIKPERSMKVHFEKIFVGAEDDTNKNTKTLGSIMKENGHRWVDVLKIDIDGGEFDVLNQVMDEFSDELPFGQLQVEIHVSDGESGFLEFPDVYRLWERLENAGMRPFMNEVNHNPCVFHERKAVPMEYSFINIKGNHRILNSN